MTTEYELASSEDGREDGQRQEKSYPSPSQYREYYSRGASYFQTNPIRTYLIAGGALLLLITLFSLGGSKKQPHYSASFPYDEYDEIWRRDVATREAIIAREGGITNVHTFNHPSLTIWDIFRPSHACPRLIERLGAWGEGGKWMCGIKELTAKGEKAIVYSIGVNHDSSFEAALLTRAPQAQVWGYDYSVDNWGPELTTNYAWENQVHFRKYGMSAVDSPESNPPLYTLGSLLRQNGHTYIDIFKIDIESSEWSVLPQIMEEYKNTELPFGQMQLELHVQSHITAEQFEKLWVAMEAAGLRAFHREMNLAPGNMDSTFRSIEFAEYSFINIRSTKSSIL